MDSKLYRKRKIDAIGREQFAPGMTVDGVWQYAHDPQATRDAALGAAVRKVVGLVIRDGVNIRTALREGWGRETDKAKWILTTIADALEAE